MQSIGAISLLEREGELDQLEDLIEEAAGGRSRLVLVEGPAGIGKTRLLEELRTRARERGMVVLHARASELDREFPFGVVRQLFEPLLAAADAERRARLLHGAAALAAALIDPSSGEAEPPGAAGDPSLARFHALYWLIANLADEAPAALVVDDAHWADESSLRFLEFLLPRLEELPVLVALAGRPAAAPAVSRAIDALATDPLAIVLRPAPLTEAAVASLVAGELGEPPDERFAVACHEATGGNPFLLRELLRELAADAVAPTAAGASLVRELAPPTVARAVLLRIARLGDDAAALARALAVLGDGAPLRRACTLAGMSEERGDELATALARADVLASARPLAFAHPVLRSAVYGDIEPGERARAHRRAAELLAEECAGPDAIAVHLLATEPSDDPYVAATLREAAGSALARGSAPVAVACLRRALAEPPPEVECAEVILELASAELHAGEPAAAAAHFEEGMRITDDPRVRAASSREYSIALQAVGRHDEGYAIRERAVEEVAVADRELALLIETSLIATACLDLSRLAWARERLDRHRGRRAAVTAAERRLLATQAYLDAMYGDQPAAAVADAAEDALASGELVDASRGAVTTPFFFAIEVLMLADRAELARRALDQVVDDARRRGSAIAFASASGWRCLLHARAGTLAEAEADARSCAELSIPQGWFSMAPPMLGYAIGALVDRGEFDFAEQVLEQSGVGDRPAGDDLTFFPMVHSRARLRAVRGDLDRGRADLAALSPMRARWNTFFTLVPAVLVAPELVTDDLDATRSTAERMLREADGWGTPRGIGMALRAAGLVEGGSRGLELLEESVAVLEASPARLEHARAMSDFGAALRRSGRRADAREPLRGALDLADACGAAPLAERVREELRAAGARPRRPRTTGADALTASERRIAAMAAEGLSNPEIAQALFVTKKTVEAHLGNAYRKLDIHSRSELAAALRRPEVT